jgi:tetratricopeptide (TPR) repeat protein
MAYCIHEDTSDHSIFWLDATTTDTLTTGLCAIDGLTNIANNTSEALAAAVVQWMRPPVLFKRLLIIDNIDVGSASNTILENLLRPTRDHHILFITRSRRIALRYAHPTDVIDMPTMSEGDAQQLLLSYIGAGAWDEESIPSLVETLEYHPLAIKSAGIYIASTGTRLTRFLTLLKQDASFLTALLDGTAVPPHHTAIRQGDHNRIYTLRSLVTCNEDIPTMLFVFSSLDCSDLPDETILSLANTDSRREAIDILKAYSLLKPITRTTRWKMPELVKHTARGQLLYSPNRARFLATALQFVAQIEAPRMDATSFAQRNYAHIAAVLTAVVTLALEREFSPGIMKFAFQLSTILCQLLVDQGKPYEAIAVSSKFISWAPMSVQKFVTASDKLRSKLGIAYYGSGQFTTAETMTREILRSQIYTIGEDHLETLHSLNNIGLYQWEQGRFSLAERCHRKALELKRTVCGPCDLEIFFTFNNLALSLESQGNFEEAEIYFVQALRGRQAKLPDSHPDVLVSKSNLGVLRGLQGRSKQARRLHEAALKGREAALGSTHPDTLKSKGNLALALQEQGLYDQSVQLLHDICQTYKTELGPSHPQAIKSLRNLAYVLHRQSKFVEAEALIREVLDTLEEKHGKGHTEAFKTIHYLATLLHWQDRLEEALEMMALLYDMRKAMLDENHPDTTNSRRYLAELKAELVASGQDSHIIICYGL